MSMLLAMTLAFLSQPDKTVVLTFDDAVKSHRSVVAPLLQERGFGATFFITHRWMDDAEHFLSWAEVGELHRMGFEIGNHSWGHGSFNTPASAALLAGELALVEHALRAVDVPQPISFAWCGNAFGPESVQVLAERGYKLARRGMQPEIAYGKMAIGPAYQPGVHHPLLIPTTGDAYPDWDLDHFKKVVAQTGEGKIVVLQFHGVPDVAHPWVHTPPEQFVLYLDYLKAEGFNVIALRDVLPWLDEAPPADPMLTVRYPEVPAEALVLPVEVAASREKADFWLRNAFVHGYTGDECAALLGYGQGDYQAQFGGRRYAPLPVPEDRLLVLPYPGVRHPRAGFLEGAVSPQRGTKLSIFAPWADGGYAVLDFPEAIFAGDDLIFLAHTHIPTVWNEQHVDLPNVDWKEEADGAWSNEWTLPNGFRFGMRAVPGRTQVDLDLWFHNGTEQPLQQIRAQHCLMLKELRGFDGQTKEGKQFTEGVCAAPDDEQHRWVLIGTSRGHRTWSNEKCPCIHADPQVESLAVGETVHIQSRVGFFDDGHVSRELLRWIDLKE